MKDRMINAVSQFDVGDYFKSFNNRQMFSIFSACVYFYLILIISIFLFLEKVTRNNNVTYRLSLQSQMGFGVEPSGLVIFTCFLLTILMFVLLVVTVRNKSTFAILKTFGELLFPSCILFAVLGIGFLFGKIDLRLSNYSIDEISKIIWVSNSWRGIAIFGIAILISFVFSVLKLKSANLISLDLSDSSFIPWLIPVIINTGFLVAITGASTVSGRYLIWFTITLNILLLLLFSISASNYIIKKLMTTFVLAITLFVYLFSHRPTQVLTWRPDLQWTAIITDRYILFSLIATLIVCTFLIRATSFYRGALIIVAGLWSGLGSNVNSTIVSSLDNFHYGEFIGYWLGFSELDQIPYKSVEFPRGILVNVLPAAFGDFLSNGYPETFPYWFITLSLLIGILFFLVTHTYLPLPVIFLLLILLPKPNGYFEIDIIMGIALLGFIALLQRIKSYALLFVWVPLFSIFLILLAPGQGLVCAIILLIVGILHLYQNRISLVFLRSWPWAIYFIGVLAFSAFLVLPSLLWVVRNGSVNNSMYGDFWLGNIFTPQQFPLSLKFGIILLAPVLFTILLVNFRKLENFQKQLGLAAILYLIAISGRWFGRVDQLDMSRVGAGLFIFLILFLVPLSYRNSNLGRVQVAGVVSLVLTIILAIAFYPFNQSVNFQQFASPATSPGQYAEMRQRGEIYKKIESIENTIYAQKAQRLNLTGGQAIDQYLGARSIGGIESPYVITNDAQEIAWKKRLEKGGVNLILGPYGSLGAGAFDGSGVGGRSPQVLSWMINRFTPIDCGLFTIAIPKSDIKDKVDYLASQGCVVPSTRIELLSLWNRIDATQSNLGWSLVSWSSQPESTLENQAPSNQSKSIRVSLTKPTDILTVKLRCEIPQLVEFIIESNDTGENLRQVFSAQIQSGTFRFKPSIFPIATLLNGRFNLNLNSTTCFFE
jgi:hypothetical protein